MGMNVGTEDHWDEFNEVVTAEPEPEPAPEPAKAAPAAPVADDFPSELAILMNKYGLEDVFYVALSADGKTRARAWSVADHPSAEGYRSRCARVSFETTGLLQHMEGSTWPE